MRCRIASVRYAAHVSNAKIVNVTMALKHSPTMLALAMCTCLGLTSRADSEVYTDTLSSGWADWSWAAVDFNNTSPTHGGTKSIRVAATNWAALYLHTTAQSTTTLSNLIFWINGGTTGGHPLL